MRIRVENVIGGSKFIFDLDEPKFMEAMILASVLGHRFEKCGMCKSTNIHLDGHKSKGYLFVNIACKDCRARRNLGSYKDGGYFWKSWEKYEPRSEPPPAKESPPIDED